MSEKVPNLGDLRDRVEFHRRDQIRGSSGGIETTYMPIATFWARVRALGSALTQFAGGEAAQVSHTAVMRFRLDVAPGDRLIYRGEKLEVISAEDLNGRRAYLVCRCRALQPTG